jgi:hypothetical protein
MRVEEAWHQIIRINHYDAKENDNQMIGPRPVQSESLANDCVVRYEEGCFRVIKDVQSEGNTNAATHYKVTYVNGYIDVFQTAFE